MLPKFECTLESAGGFQYYSFPFSKPHVKYGNFSKVPKDAVVTGAGFEPLIQEGLVAALK